MTYRIKNYKPIAPQTGDAWSTVKDNSYSRQLRLAEDNKRAYHYSRKETGETVIEKR